MKICFFCDSIFSFGGVQRVLAVVAKALSANHTVTILTMDKSSVEDMSLYDLDQSSVNIQYFEYPSQAFYKTLPNKVYSFLYKKLPFKNKLTSKIYSCSSYPSSYRSLLIKELNAGEYDVVVGVHAFISIRLGIIRRDLKAPNVIGWMHNSYDAFFNNPGLFLWEQKKQFQYEISKLDNFIVLSNDDKIKYEQEMSLNPIVIANPLTLAPQGQGNKSYKSFLAVGRLVKAKGFDLLIKSFANFSKHNNDWVLNIVGEGTEGITLQNLITENNLGDRVFIHPFTKDIQHYYASSSVFILSSRWEGWGLVVCEAMAHALPVVASNLPVIREILDNSKSALTFESENVEDLAEKLLLITTMDLDYMGEKSIEVSKRFDVSAVIREWEYVFSHR